jgi:hypothetical protein
MEKTVIEEAVGAQGRGQKAFMILVGKAEREREN